MNINLFGLSKDQTNVIKGAGITMICLHNFVHWILPIGENEISFFASHVVSTYGIMLDNSFSVSSIINALLSFWGHYGVQLFIFCSGFGLVRKYEKEGDSINFKKYMIVQLKKIYPLLIVGILFAWFVQLVSTHRFSETTLLSNILLLLMIRNFHFETIFMTSGPLWFFGLIFQLYILFPFLLSYLKKKKEKGFLILLLGSYIISYIAYPICEKLSIPYFGNALGHIPEFILGMGFALFPHWRISWKIVIPSFIIFILSNFYVIFFPLSYLTITILLLTLIYPIMKMQNVMVRCIAFIGSISMYLFILNGEIRRIVLHATRLYLEPKDMPMSGLLALIIINLLICILGAYILSLIYPKINPFVKKKKLQL